MDSLLASYASSDEDEREEESMKPPSNSSVFSSLPPPKSPFFSLPPPKSNLPKPSFQEPHKLAPSSSISQQISEPKPKPSSLFSALPQPKAQKHDPKIQSNTKKVVQFRPPINPPSRIDDDDDEDDEEKEKQRKKVEALESVNKTSSFKSISSILPAPKNSTAFGSVPSSSGTGRRSILETDVPAGNSNVGNASKPGITLNVDNSVDNTLNVNSVSESYTSYDSYSGYNAGSETSNLVSAGENYANYDTYGGHSSSFNDASNLGADSDNYANSGSYDVNYDGYGTNYEQYENKWIDKSSTTEMTMPVEIMGRSSGKRGRNEVPQDIVEVKQDELMKNRPREDKSRLTGIAFGPSYQPVSAKGKPSKLHKRKHQIGTLYFDMKQKQTELQERRAKGFLTKAETHAKYGW